MRPPLSLSITGWLIAVLPAGRLHALGACLVAAVCWLPAEATVVTNAAPASAVVLVLGDSISAGYGLQRNEGWPHLLQQRLARQAPAWQVVNASISGETTGGGLARLPDLLARHRPDVVVVELGGNDGLRGYPASRIRRNLTAIAELVRSSGAAGIVAGMHIPPNYGPRYTRDFHAVFSTIARDFDFSLVPFLLDGIATRPELMQSDGIHPTAAAQPLIVDNLWPQLAPLLGCCATTDGDVRLN